MRANMGFAHTLGESDMNTSNNKAVLEMVDHKATIDERGYNSNFEIVCVEKMLRDYLTINGYKDVVFFNVKCQIIRKDEGVWRCQGGFDLNIRVERPQENTFKAAQLALIGMMQEITEQMQYKILIPNEFLWEEYEVYQEREDFNY